MSVWVVECCGQECQGRYCSQCGKKLFTVASLVEKLSSRAEKRQKDLAKLKKLEESGQGTEKTAGQIDRAARDVEEWETYSRMVSTLAEQG